MGLRDIKLPSASIQVTDDASLVVRGLGAREITDLVLIYQGIAQPLFDKLTSMKTGRPEDVEASSFTRELIETIARNAPTLLSEIIAIAADDPEAVEFADRLPPTVQIEAIQQIFVLTFRTEAERKNAVETVMKAINGTAGILNSLSNRR